MEDMPEVLALYQEIESLSDMKKSFKYEVKGKVKTLDLSEVYLATVKRGSFKMLSDYVAKTREYFLPGGGGFSWTEIKKQTSEQLLANEVANFLEDLGAWKAYEGVEEKKLKDLAKDYNFTQGFLKWYMSKKGLTVAQLGCDHDDSDQYTTDGHFYNSVGVCKKCLIEMEDSLDYNENLDMLYEAWSRK